ncbi:TRAP transporter substrate-binding protein [Arenibaculum pallidiluteum]|uniref:TRAP transporter substrate-binding protein n=1 Tax=Arenibaculum pallidiluteum TaxID=2812559 RepID=UPI001A977C96|nr:TRAP transporter substrate-binding protein [Arenibaculum pallidiluteum]
MASIATRRAFLAGSAALAGAVSMPAIVRAQRRVLKISHYLAPTHGIETDFLRPWAEEVKARTGGAVNFEIFPVSSAFGKAERQADQARAGIVDIAFGLSGIPRGRFPHTSLIELPFVVERAEAGSAALWQLYRSGDLGNEYDDFKVLMLMTHHGGLFHTVNRPVRTLEDLRGMRIRSPGPAVNAMLEFLGASPVGMPPAQIYESLERGALDGLATTWDLVAAVRANEVLKHHTDARLYAAAFYTVMNRRSYDALPQEVRQVIDETTGDALQPKIGPWWDKWDAIGKQDAVKRGHAVVEVGQETREQWRQQLQPMIAQYLQSVKAEGVKDPEALYQKMLQLAQQKSR